MTTKGKVIKMIYMGSNGAPERVSLVDIPKYTKRRKINRYKDFSKYLTLEDVSFFLQSNGDNGSQYVVCKMFDQDQTEMFSKGHQNRIKEFTLRKEIDSIKDNVDFFIDVPTKKCFSSSIFTFYEKSATSQNL